METSPLQKREVFHLEFLRALLRRVPADAFALKGGANLRFFFRSIRYSEDMDLDSRMIPVDVLRERVMAILGSPSFLDNVRSFGIVQMTSPDLKVAKQTETVQRFKVHLRTGAGEDLSTKIEFSRRGFDPEVKAEAVAADVVAAYRMPPLIAPHYLAQAAVRQKIRALGARAEPQPRDVFDLHLLSGQPEAIDPRTWQLPRALIRDARERALSMEYGQYRDTVVAFLHPDDRSQYNSSRVWDEIRLVVAGLLERGLER